MDPTDHRGPHGSQRDRRLTVGHRTARHTRLNQADTGTRALEEKAEEQYRALAELRRTMDALAMSTHERAEGTDRRIAALGREFESTVNRLTGNQEIIAGVKAFLRLLRTPDAGDGALAP
ncbi:hypothetical protein [Streptomyces sp. NPDC056160]|uniref:hypothetical protein n=1 Tax=Streptomyces sp. NPDC056160 TaxID=3345731 RepID=UPI0035E0F2C6